MNSLSSTKAYQTTSPSTFDVSPAAISAHGRRRSAGAVRAYSQAASAAAASTPMKVPTSSS